MEKFRVCVVGLFLVIVSSLSLAQEPYGTCQSGCNVVTRACYAASGVVYGAGYVPRCSAAQSICMAMCHTATQGATVGATATAAASTVGAGAVVAGAAATITAIAAVAAGVIWIYRRNRQQNQNAAN